MRVMAAALFMLLANPVAAQNLVPAGAMLTASEGPIADSVTLPRAPYTAGTTPQSITGTVTRRAFRLPGRSDTPVQIAAPIEQALRDDGFEIVFSCSETDCGGFDFRFQLSLLPAPAMFVDLGDFRYVLARREGKAGERFVSLLASRAGDTGTLHITEVAPLRADAMPPRAEDSESEPVASPLPVTAEPFGMIAALEQSGHVVLSDIDFPSGAADLPPGAYASLRLIADWLADAGEARVVLVGHTDAIGSLEANTELSRRRAASVARAITDLAPQAGPRISSAGAGYLSPIASNLTEEGRALNRRVEIVLLSR